MEITLTETAVWDTDKGLYQQSGEVILLVEAAVKNEPVGSETDPCLDGFTRPTQTTYALTDTCNIQLTFIYNTGPMEKGFMGLTDTIYTILNK